MSRNDSVLLAWGSRSMRSVGLPRSASAAARLIAVVVFPTPPFWLAIATIMLGSEGIVPRGRRFQIADFRCQSDWAIGRNLIQHSAISIQHLHLVLAHVVRVQAL